jgi:tetratricopeptide (TPR) repeat protein
MSEESRRDLFISYNKADRAWAVWIAWLLEDAGYTTVLQAWDFTPGGNFVLKMDEAAAKSERTIAVLSPEYLAAEFTQPEWAARFAEDPTGEKGLLIPVRVRTYEATGLWRALIYLDLVGLDEGRAQEALLEGVQRGRRKPKRAPAFPGAARSVETRPRFPGALPPIHNLPLRNPNFTGRESYLTALREQLASGRAAALTQAISGLGGVGKTQLALEYAFRHAGDYGLIWWLRAEEPAGLAAGCAELARKLDLPEQDATEQAVVIEAVRAYLEQHGGWLLVFDNAAEPADLRAVRPGGDTGHVLLTSRNPNWGAVAESLAVEVLPRDESVAFLLKRTKQKDQAAADALADALGDLPLALEHAAAYVTTSGTTMAHYLELFRTRRAELLAKAQPPDEYEATVATTWSVSIDRVPKESPAAADLLNFLAHLGPDAFPKDVLVAGAEFLPEPLAATVRDPLSLDDALAALRRYSLLDVADDAFSVHRLVQAVVRDALGDKSAKTWTAAAVEVVNDAFPYDVLYDPGNWPTCSGLLPHGLAAAEHAERLEVALERTGRLLNQIGLYLKTRADLAQARSVFERAVRVGEATYGPDHPNVAIRVNNLGDVLQDLDDLPGARAHFERALRIDEAAYGPDHPEVATDVNNLGLVLRSLGDLPGARAHLERALRIWEANLGPDHPQVATGVNNLGLVLQDLGDLPVARAHFERALRIDEAAYGPDHPDVARDVNNLGLVLQDLGDLPGARAHFERALRIWEAVYPPEHPHIAIARESLAIVLRELDEGEGQGL